MGDRTGTMLLKAMNAQIESLEPGTTVELRNAKVIMFRSTMRLAVDRWGAVVRQGEHASPDVPYEDVDMKRNFSLGELQVLHIPPP